MLYEYRWYPQVMPGRMENLKKHLATNARMLINDYGWQPIAYWQPITGPNNQLHYIFAWPDLEYRRRKYEEFLADPRWHTALADSERDGANVSGVNNAIWETVDYSPVVVVPPLDPPDEGGWVYERIRLELHPGRGGHVHQLYAEAVVPWWQRHDTRVIGVWQPVIGPMWGGEITVVLQWDTLAARADATAALLEDPTYQAALTRAERDGPILISQTVDFWEATSWSPTITAGAYN